MTVINGLPAHVLFVHFIVVLAPLTAALEIICALWPAARRGMLVWVTLILAAVTAVLSPITINAGEWLYDLRANPAPALREHAERGDTMIYFSAALLIVAIAIAALHLAERRTEHRRAVVHIAVAILAIVVGVSTTIQVYRIGDSGSQSVWGGEIARLKHIKGK